MGEDWDWHYRHPVVGGYILLLVGGVLWWFALSAMLKGRLQVGGGRLHPGHLVTPDSNPLVFWLVILVVMALGTFLIGFALRSVIRFFRKPR
jgi:hypothetical protein